MVESISLFLEKGTTFAIIAVQRVLCPNVLQAEDDVLDSAEDTNSTQHRGALPELFLKFD